jgi:hypothetical protein
VYQDGPHEEEKPGGRVPSDAQASTETTSVAATLARWGLPGRVVAAGGVWWRDHQILRLLPQSSAVPDWGRGHAGQALPSAVEDPVTAGDGPAERMAAVRSLLAHETGDLAVLLRRVCLAATRELAAAGAGISVMTDGGLRGLSAGSDPDAERIEDLQFLLGEGPCISAFDGRRPVLVPDLADAAMTRWPVYAPAAYDGGVRAVFAFPLQVGGVRLGVLDVFRDRPGPLGEAELAVALTFADVTVEALLDRHERDNQRDAIDGPAVDVGHRAQLFQAQGMVMVQLGVPLGEALVRMRAYAYAENRRLADVAHDIVARRLRLDQAAE